MTDFIKDLYQTKDKVKIYIVGGYNRDQLLDHFHKENNNKILPKDYDLLVTGLLMDDITEVLSKHGKVKKVGKAFGIIIFVYHYNNIKYSIDVALPRKEVSTGPKYKDFKLDIDPYISVEKDIERRDATINGIAIQLFSIDDLFNNDYVKECYHYHQERIINPFNGILDLKNKIWKAINNPYQRFLEDPTRMLRALYQCSKHDLELEEETKDSLIKHSNLLKIIDDSSLVRLTNEFLRMINTRYFYKWMDFIFEETDILNYLGLYFNKENVEDVKKSFNYISENLDLSENLTLIIKLATILYYSFLDNQKKIDKWTRKFMLSACPKFPKNGTNVPLFCLKSFEGIKNIDNLNNLKEDYLLIKIKMRYLISTLGPTDSMDDVKKAIILFEVLTMRKQEKLLELYEENKNIPINESKINLNGKMIKEIFHVEDKKIGEIKRYLFKNILEDKIENKEEQLIEFMNDYYVKNMNNELL